MLLENVVSNADRLASFHSLTVITTYMCTAACKQCCFESSPKLKARLTRSEILNAIEQANTHLPNLDCVIFSGGECFALKDDLYDAIRFAASHGHTTRCVTNGYWGKTAQKAEEIANAVSDAGLSEINFSTGLEHQEFVPLESVLNAAEACIKKGIFTLITVEKDTDDSRCWLELNEHEIYQRIKDEKGFLIQKNSWMPFHKYAKDRGNQIPITHIDRGCDQLFTNVIVTPHNMVSACCGLTFEHIPEMKIGSLSKESLHDICISEFDDFLKIWIHVEGPIAIIKSVSDDGGLLESLGRLDHICQACAYMHNKDEIRNLIFERYHEHVDRVMSKYILKRKIGQIKQDALVEV